jgi:carbon-monoxide dehydrogenase small subunit
VLVDGKVRYSCMTYTLSMQNRNITSIEGLAVGAELDPIQRAFIETGAVQCGYCTCGFIMAAKELLSLNSAPSESEIRRAIAGNLCRCTGYQKIVDAIKLAALNYKLDNAIRSQS